MLVLNIEWRKRVKIHLQRRMLLTVETISSIDQEEPEGNDKTQ
jgi:hypothetical protein